MTPDRILGMPCRMLHVTCVVRHVARCMFYVHVACVSRMSDVTCRLVHVACCMLHVACARTRCRPARDAIRRRTSAQCGPHESEMRQSMLQECAQSEGVSAVAVEADYAMCIVVWHAQSYDVQRACARRDSCQYCAAASNGGCSLHDATNVCIQQLPVGTGRRAQSPLG